MSSLLGNSGSYSIHLKILRCPTDLAGDDGSFGLPEKLVALSAPAWVRCPTKWRLDDLSGDDSPWLPGETGPSVGVLHTDLGGNVQGIWNSRLWRVNPAQFSCHPPTAQWVWNQFNLGYLSSIFAERRTLLKKNSSYFGRVCLTHIVSDYFCSNMERLIQLAVVIFV